MTRLLYPDVADRTTQRAGAQYFGVVIAGTPVAFFTDEDGTVPADVLHEDGSAVTVDAPLLILAGSLLPYVQGPDSFVARLYVRVGGGAPWPVRPQLDLLPGGGGGGGGAVTSVAGRTGAVVLSTTDVSGLGTAATRAASSFDTAGAAASAQAASAQKSANLTDLSSASAARTALGLGTIATHATAEFDAAGTADTAVATFADTLGSAAFADTSAFDAAGAAATKQPLDSDLTAIAALTPADGDVIMRISGSWLNRTMAQLKTALGLAKADVGLGSVDNTSDTGKPVSTAQQTALDAKVPTTRTVSAGTGLSGGGDLTANRTLSLATSVQTDIDGRIPKSTVTAAGDMLVGTGTGAVGRIAVAADGKVWTVVSGAPAWADAAGGGGGAAITRTGGRITSGDIALPNTSGVWQILPGASFVSPPAAAGDYLELEVGGIRKNYSSSFVDIAVIVSGAAVWYASSGTSTPAVEGLPDFYGAADVPLRSAPIGLDVLSGHLSGGVVTFGLACLGDGGGSAVVYASTSYPLRWRILNYGAI